MNTVIWKYELNITDLQSISIPAEPQFLSVQFQRDNLCLWVMVDPKKQKEIFDIEIIGTGNPAPYHDRVYIGTAQQFGGMLVWHVFVRQ